MSLNILSASLLLMGPDATSLPSSLSFRSSQGILQHLYLKEKSRSTIQNPIGSPLQAGGLPLPLRLRHQPVLHRHCQGLHRTPASSLLERLQPRFQSNQLLCGLYSKLQMQRRRQQSPGKPGEVLLPWH